MNSVQTTSKAFELVKGAGMLQDLKDRFMPPERPTFKEDLTLEGYPNAGMGAGMIGGGVLGYKSVTKPIVNGLNDISAQREAGYTDLINGFRGGTGDDYGDSFLKTLRGRGADFIDSNPTRKAMAMEALERVGKIPKVGGGTLVALLAALGAPLAGFAAGGIGGNAAGTSLRDHLYGTSRINKLQNKRDAFEAYSKRVGGASIR